MVHITELDNNKSPGYDLMNNKVLKKSTNKIILFLTCIYNTMLKQSYFSQVWKFSTIIFVSQTEKPKHLGISYCSINVLLILGKLFEKLLLKRIVPITKKKRGSYQIIKLVSVCITRQNIIGSKINEHCPGVLISHKRLTASGIMDYCLN